MLGYSRPLIKMSDAKNIKLVTYGMTITEKSSNSCNIVLRPFPPRTESKE